MTSLETQEKVQLQVIFWRKTLALTLLVTSLFGSYEVLTLVCPFAFFSSVFLFLFLPFSFFLNLAIWMLG